MNPRGNVLFGTFPILEKHREVNAYRVTFTGCLNCLNEAHNTSPDQGRDLGVLNFVVLHDIYKHNIIHLITNKFDYKKVKA